MSSEVLRVLQSKAEIRAFYNKIARAYDLWADHAEAPMRRKGLEMLAVCEGDRVLEVGFGTGHCLLELAQAAGRSGRVTGIDLSDQMAVLTSERLRDSPWRGNVDLALGDAGRLPFADGSFDALFLSFILEIFDTPDIPKALAEFRRVLRPGGRLGLVALSKAGQESFAVRAYEWTHRHFPHLLDCRPIYAEGSLREAGFEILESALERMWVPVEVVTARNPAKRNPS